MNSRIVNNYVNISMIEQYYIEFPKIRRSTKGIISQRALATVRQHIRGQRFSRKWSLHDVFFSHLCIIIKNKKKYNLIKIETKINEKWNEKSHCFT